MEINDDLKAAKDVIQALLKAKKMIRMYPSNNPIYVKTLEDTYARFRDYFDYRDDLLLKIRQNVIMWENEQVYYNVEKEDNLALFLFKDGLRELTFKKGLAADGMEQFLKITVRQALSNIQRPGGQTLGVMVSIGVGVMVILAIALLGQALVRQVGENRPNDSPTFFFVDIHPDQGGGLFRLDSSAHRRCGS